MRRAGDEITPDRDRVRAAALPDAQPARVLSKAQILDRVWNYDFGGQANVVELYISYLRKKIDAGREPMIHTMRGAGLRAEAGLMTRGRFRSLTSRLVLTAVALVAVVSVLVGAATTLAMRGYLIDQLDNEVAVASTASQPRRTPGAPAPIDRDGDGDERHRHQAAGHPRWPCSTRRRPTAEVARRPPRRRDRARRRRARRAAPTCPPTARSTPCRAPGRRRLPRHAVDRAPTGRRRGHRPADRRRRRRWSVT